jgi:hypothetical protein
MMAENMENKPIGLFSFLIFFFITLAVLIDIYSARGLTMVKNLAESDKLENGIISQVYDRHNSVNSTVYFILKNDNREYRINMFGLSFHGKPGDDVHVLFNEQRSFWVLKEHIKGSKAYYLGGLIMSVLPWVLAIIFYWGICKIKSE